MPWSNWIFEIYFRSGGWGTRDLVNCFQPYVGRWIHFSFVTFTCYFEDSLMEINLSIRKMFCPHGEVLRDPSLWQNACEVAEISGLGVRNSKFHSQFCPWTSRQLWRKLFNLFCLHFFIFVKRLDLLISVLSSKITLLLDHEFCLQLWGGHAPYCNQMMDN